MKYTLFLLAALAFADDAPKAFWGDEPAKVPAEIELAYVRAVAIEQAAITALQEAAKAMQASSEARGAAAKALTEFCATQGRVANYNEKTRVVTCAIAKKEEGAK